MLKQSVDTTSLVCEVEFVEGPTLWKKMRALLRKEEGDDSANKPAIKDATRRLISDLGLRAPVYVWLRQKFIHKSAGGRMLQVMVRIHTSELPKFLKMLGALRCTLIQEMRTRDSITVHSVIWLPRGRATRKLCSKQPLFRVSKSLGWLVLREVAV